MSFYQSGMNERLQCELTFNDYTHVIIAAGDNNAKYTVCNISLDYHSVSNTELVRLIRNQYMGRLIILYDGIQRQTVYPVSKSDTQVNINLDVVARSMKDILMLFQDPAAGGLNPNQ